LRRDRHGIDATENLRLPRGGRPPRPRRLGRLPPRVNRVVVRSLAEFCLALDTALAVVIVIVTMRR
jgi:hypothetical protein